jgi:hypothetical protein
LLGKVASVAAVCAVIVTCGLAHAERRQVAVVALSPDSDASQLAKQLNDTLVDHPDLRPIDPVFSTALQGPFEDEDADNLRRARQERANADTALSLAQPDFGGAAAAVKSGVGALSMVTPTPEMLAIYADLMFDLGQAQLGQGKTVDASRSFALVRRLDPNRKPDPARYLPEITEAYDATSKPVSRSPLLVKGSGTVWIDGRAVGPAPQTQTVDDGLHLVQLTGPDREPRGEQVIIPQTSEIEIAPALATDELKVKRARLELTRAKDAMTRASAVRRLAQLLQVGDAVIIWKSPAGALVVQTWRNNETGFAKIVEHGSEPPLDLLTPLSPPRPKPTTNFVEPITPPIVVEIPWYKKRWVQASAVTGVLAVIVTSVMIARRDQFVDFGGGDVKVDAP